MNNAERENTILEFRNISKEFPGVKALNDILFGIRHGTIHCICGENGAGKSTLMKVINGLYKPESRLSAFNDGLAEKEDATIVATEHCDWLKDSVMTTTQNWLVAYPELDVVIASCDDIAMGAIEAIEMAGMQEQVKVFSIDGTEVGIQAVADGRLECTVQQDTAAYASRALGMVEQLLQGEDPENIEIDSTLISAENVADYVK